ncbi:acyl-CoA dehydrogenase family protein [Raineyella sp. LH-20]|uniref:acyl-CoA dehydrogenase family protein n=1 Tax=Raineyella sp. LH-20 TaxID=3081204 RepID=UPI0029540F40|nr:acyl-CoA dehydrogenase family protein [Raineyella sp. LH-20]WOP18084.1 acyl-CoA dehydrogenase family protein [Raineyella sp. LH-20]
MTAQLRRLTGPAPRPALLAAAQRLIPVFNELAAGAVAREADHVIDHDAIDRLRAAGYTTLRIPTEFGGAGLGLAEFYPFVIELGTADPNLVQALRAHLLCVEQLLVAPQDERRARWLHRIGAGAVVGNAVTEVDNRAGQVTTRVSHDGDAYRLDGTKYYSTGSLYADWIQVHAEDEEGRSVWAFVPSDAPGVTMTDDWDGFGQRLTASGTTVFTGVPVAADEVVPSPYSTAASHAQALAQSVHLANLAGIAQSIVRDATAYVAGRTRSYSHANTPLPRHDPQVQQVIGELSAAAYAARAVFLAFVDELAEVQHRVAAGIATDDDYTAIDISAYQAQLAIAPSVLRAATQLFEVGGASQTSRARGLDRHWRNARVLAQHNPLIYRARLAGSHLLNGGHRAVQYTVGTAPGAGAAAATATTSSSAAAAAPDSGFPVGS